MMVMMMETVHKSLFGDGKDKRFFAKQKNIHSIRGFFCDGSEVIYCYYNNMTNVLNIHHIIHTY
jgi:hypothetical protein